MSVLDDNRSAFHSALLQVDKGRLSEVDALSTLEFLFRVRAFNEPAAVGAMHRLAAHTAQEVRTAAIKGLMVIYLHGRAGESGTVNVNLTQLRDSVNRAAELGGLSEGLIEYLARAVPELSDENRS